MSDAALAGSTVVGYVAVTAAGVVVFVTSLENGTVYLHPSTSVIVAGVRYPIVFCGSGGLVAWGFAPERREIG